MTKPARDWERDWELCQKATPGPWYPRATDDERFMNARYVSTDPGPGWLHDGEQGMSVEECEPEKVIAITLLQAPRLASVEDGKWNENTEFIAEAREALPYWLQRVKELEDALRQCVEALELSSHKELCKMTVAPYDLIDYAKRVLEGERNDVDGLGLESLVESGANQSLGKGGQSRMPSAHPAGEGMGRDDGAEMGRRAWHTE